MLVAIQTVGQFFDLPVLVLYLHRESLVCSVPLDAQRQVTLQIRTAVNSVMTLIVLLVTKHVNTIEIRLADLVRTKTLSTVIVFSGR